MHFRKYPVNERYFDVWSPNMAYILGFVLADGSVSRHSLRVEVAKRDIEVLEFIRSELCPTARILHSQKGTARRLNINSVVLVKSLAKYGIIKNKTGKEHINFHIPQELFGDFIRGLFDGDGWVCLRRNSIESGIVSRRQPLCIKYKRNAAISDTSRLENATVS